MNMNINNKKLIILSLAVIQGLNSASNQMMKQPKSLLTVKKSKQKMKGIQKTKMKANQIPVPFMNPAVADVYKSMMNGGTVKTAKAVLRKLTISNVNSISTEIKTLCDYVDKAPVGSQDWKKYLEGIGGKRLSSLIIKFVDGEDQDSKMLNSTGASSVGYCAYAINNPTAPLMPFNYQGRRGCCQIAYFIIDYKFTFGVFDLSNNTSNPPVYFGSLSSNENLISLMYAGGKTYYFGFGLPSNPSILATGAQLIIFCRQASGLAEKDNLTPVSSITIYVFTSDPTKSGLVDASGKVSDNAIKNNVLGMLDFFGKYVG